MGYYKKKCVPQRGHDEVVCAPVAGHREGMIRLYGLLWLQRGHDGVFGLIWPQRGHDGVVWAPPVATERA